ncbi:hypothetical protein [Dokdonia sp.]|uniref:hypothetical protein n=1 Tax=Dokdonia sp. TaxID=2024995 RepID=UPI00326404F3
MNDNKRYIVCMLLSLLFIECTTTKQLQFKKGTTNNIELGVIVKKEGVLKNNIEVKGIPLLTEKLKVTITQKEFTKTSFAKYNSIYNSQKPIVSYSDDSQNKPTYFEVELIDDIGYATAINNDISIREYVKNSKDAGVITKIAMVTMATIDMTGVTASFIEDTANKTYAVSLYKKEELVQTINFSEVVIFEYQTSYFCYGKNERGQVVVMDIVEEGKSCKRPLERKAKKLNTIKRLADY